MSIARTLAVAALTLLVTAPPALADETAPAAEGTASSASTEATPSEPTTSATAAPTDEPSAEPSSPPASSQGTEAASEPAQSEQQEQPEQPAPDTATGPTGSATPEPQTTALATTKAAAAPAASCASTPSVSFPTSAVALGGKLRVVGSGWCHPDGTGSVIGVKIDEGAISRLDTSVHANKTIWAIVEAADDGTFDTEITMPDGTTQTSVPALSTGSHSLRLLTGSLKAGDTGRTLASPQFTVLPAGTSTDDPAGWGVEVTAGDARAWVQRDVDSSGTLRIAGTGWLAKDGRTPSTVAVKLNSSDTQQFQRSTGVVRGDSTIWAMLTTAPSGANERQIRPDGSFDVELDLPAGLTQGQYLTVRLASGKFGADDVQRSAISPFLAVDGTAYTAPEDGADVTCTPTTATTTVTVETPTVPLGGTVVVSGTGWCHPVGGGSRIGVKIDDGAISHLDTSLHSNRTIWAIVQARHSDGTFRAEITLPDGTTRTSTPALTNGAHTLRFLSGSLRTGDKVRTLDADFVVGVYRPNGIPDPLAKSDLRKGTRHGVVVRTTKRKVRVTVPGATPGEWLFLSAYAADGSPRYPWDRWFRADAHGRVVAPIRKDAPTGRLKLVVQSGDQGRVGELRGWDDVVLRTVPAPVVEKPAATTVAPVVLPVASQSPALVVPQAPATTYAGLGSLSAHGATATTEDSVVTLAVPQAEPGATVFLTVYSRGRAIPAGWVTLDDDRRARVDLRRLGAGAYRIAVQGEDGTLLGWVDAVVEKPAGATVEEEPVVADVPEQPVAREETPVQAASAPFVGPADGWLIGLGALVLAGTGLFVQTRKGA